MRNTLRHIVLLSLTLSVLLGSFGVALSRQFCEVTGLQNYAAAAAPDSCCGDEAGNSTDDCCQEHVAYQKLEPVSTLKEYSLQVPVLALATPTPFIPAYQASQHTQRVVLSYSDSSPPLYGKQLLHFLHTLIV